MLLNVKLSAYFFDKKLNGSKSSYQQLKLAAFQTLNKLSSFGWVEQHNPFFYQKCKLCNLNLSFSPAWIWPGEGIVEVLNGNLIEVDSCNLNILLNIWPNWGSQWRLWIANLRTFEYKACRVHNRHNLLELSLSNSWLGVGWRRWSKGWSFCPSDLLFCSGICILLLSRINGKICKSKVLFLLMNDFLSCCAFKQPAYQISSLPYYCELSEPMSLHQIGLINN